MRGTLRICGVNIDLAELSEICGLTVGQNHFNVNQFKDVLLAYKDGRLRWAPDAFLESTSTVSQVTRTEDGYVVMR